MICHSLTQNYRFLATKESCCPCVLWRHRPIQGAKVQLHLFLTSTINRSERQHHSTATFSQGKNPRGDWTFWRTENLLTLSQIGEQFLGCSAGSTVIMSTAGCSAGSTVIMSTAGCSAGSTVIMPTAGCSAVKLNSKLIAIFQRRVSNKRHSCRLKTGELNSCRIR